MSKLNTSGVNSSLLNLPQHSKTRVMDGNGQADTAAAQDPGL